MLLKSVLVPVVVNFTCYSACFTVCFDILSARGPIEYVIHPSAVVACSVSVLSSSILVCC